MTATPRRAAIFGPELWATVAGAPWCHFDRWFALVAATSFAGDLDALEEELVARLRSSLHCRGNVEAKLSHLAELRGRMADAGIDAAVLAGHEEADKATLAKARRKVLEQALEGRAMTNAMRGNAAGPTGPPGALRALGLVPCRPRPLVREARRPKARGPCFEGTQFRRHPRAARAAGPLRRVLAAVLPIGSPCTERSSPSASSSPSAATAPTATSASFASTRSPPIWLSTRPPPE